MTGEALESKVSLRRHLYLLRRNIRSPGMDNQAQSPTALFNEEDFRGRLLQVMLRAGVNQTEFARRLGISPGFMSDMMRGLKRPGMDFLLSIKTIFGVSVDWLLTGAGAPDGASRIDLQWLKTIQLFVMIARAALIERHPAAQEVLRLLADNDLALSDSDTSVQTYIGQLQPTPQDMDFSLELYNGHLWHADALDQRRNVLAAAMSHFEMTMATDGMALLSRAPGRSVQVNVGLSQRISGKARRKQ